MKTTVTPSAGGFLVACSCGDERWFITRRAAEKIRGDHDAEHVKKEGAK